MAHRRKLVNKITEQAVNERAYGSNEPALTKHLSDILNWYSYMADDDMAKNWLQEYLIAADRKNEAKQLNQVPKDWIPRTAGWLSRLALRGYPLTDHNFETIEKQLTRAFSFIEPETIEVIEKVEKLTVQDHIKEKASTLIGELEGMIDDKVIVPGWSFYNFLRGQNVSTVITNKLIEHFTPIASELVEAIDTTDKDLKEGYKKYSTDELTDLAVIYQSLLDDAVNYAAVAKKSRKPRRTKAPSVEKLLKHFQYTKINEAYKIASIDPSKILGSQELWTFNPKNKVLTVWRAHDSDGLKIKRSTIININENMSVAKRIGRHTEERLQDVLKGGRVVLRKVMDNINTDPVKLNRINKDTILLRVI